MPRSEPCSSCRLLTTGRSRLDPQRPLCSRCQARPLKPVTLADVAKRPAAPKGAQCRICLAVDVPLKSGRCKDRAACESRQPPLFAGGEL